MSQLTEHRRGALLTAARRASLFAAAQGCILAGLLTTGLALLPTTIWWS